MPLGLFEHLITIKRLYDVIECTKCFCLRDHILLSNRRYDDDLRFAPDLTKYIHTVHVRHDDIKKDKIGLLCSEFLDRFCSISHLYEIRISGTFKDVTQYLTHKS